MCNFSLNRTGRVTLVVIAVALSTTVAISPADAGTSVEARLETAGRYFRTAELARRGNPVRAVSYAKAETLAAQVIRDNPSAAEAHFLLFAARGRRLLDESGRPSPRNFWKFSGLNKHLSRTLELDPGHARALAAKGGLLLDLPPYLGGDVQAARRHLERAIKLNPTGPGTRLSLARVLVRQGLRGRAREQALLAAHYSCRRRKSHALREAEEFLRTLDSGSL